MHTLVIKNATMIDGSGSPDGRLVTPGWVDIHTQRRHFALGYLSPIHYEKEALQLAQ